MRKGNFRPLMFLLTAYPAVGAGYDVLVNDLILGKKPAKNALDQYLRGLAASGGLGMLETMYSATNFPEGLEEFALGPTLTFIANTITDVRGGNMHNLARDMIRRTPYAGRILRTRLFRHKRHHRRFRNMTKRHKRR